MEAGDRRQFLLAGVLFTLAAVSIGLIVLLISWGGRIEATLLVFGTPIFAALDGGRPRALLLLALPIALIGGALRASWRGARKRSGRGATAER